MKRVLVGIVLLMLVIQLIRPDRSNVPEDHAKNIHAFVTIPDTIDAILVRSCYDCHSNTTRWPWYSGFAPASWIIADDVQMGRRHLNFSEWGTYPQKRMRKKLYEISEVVKDKSMPLHLYLNFHSAAKLSSSEIQMLANWADDEADRIVVKEEP